jgi:hypothetical protein
MSGTLEAINKFTSSTRNLPGLALMLMLASVLLPAAYYSYHLKDPRPSQLLVAICIGVFSSVVFLWILDSVAILQFRSSWVSRSVYGLAIASILGTSVGVYKDAFSDAKYPYEGRWEVLLINPKDGREIAHKTVALVYSERSDTYWGNSDYEPLPTDSAARAAWLGVNDFNPKEKRAVLNWYSGAGEKFAADIRVDSERAGRLFVGKMDDQTTVRISRPN